MGHVQVRKVLVYRRVVHIIQQSSEADIGDQMYPISSYSDQETIE